MTKPVLALLPDGSIQLGNALFPGGGPYPDLAIILARRINSGEVRIADLERLSRAIQAALHRAMEATV